MKKSYNKWFLSKVRQAISKYNMIQYGDKIAIGLSGGKDSIMLLYVLSHLRNFKDFNFEIVGIHVDLGWNIDITPIANYCKENKIEFHIHVTNIAQAVFEDRKEDNPCYLCSRLRKGALSNKAKDLGCNKIALGHHADDAVETLFLNMFYNGQLGSFKPYKHDEKKDIAIIRPLIYLQEKTIESVVKRENLPVIQNCCPANKNTKREEIKKIIQNLSLKYKDIRIKVIKALENVDYDNMWI